MQPNLPPPTFGQTDGVKRFTSKRKAVQFYVDGDLFVCAPALPAGVAFDLTRVYSEIAKRPGQEKLDSIMQFFQVIMEDNSYNLFSARMKDKANPIDLPTLLEISQWLVGEAYGLRPTQQPSLSPDGHKDSGLSSMAGAQAVESIQTTFLGVDS